MRPARRDNGNDCSQILPGPRKMASRHRQTPPSEFRRVWSPAFRPFRNPIALLTGRTQVRTPNSTVRASAKLRDSHGPSRPCVASKTGEACPIGTRPACGFTDRRSIRRLLGSQRQARPSLGRGSPHPECAALSSLALLSPRPSRILPLKRFQMPREKSLDLRTDTRPN